MKWLAGRDFALLADEPGLGKSAQAIAACDANGLDRILVLCPASLRGNWAREFQKFQQQSRSIDPVFGTRPVGADVTIASYDFAARRPEALAGAYDALILDECFPRHTAVETEIGPVSIGNLVDAAMPVRVWAKNKRGNLELRAITRFVRTTAPKKMVRLHFEGGKLECTPSHKIFVEGQGFVAASEVEPGQNLRVVRDALSGSARSQSLLQQALLRALEGEESAFAGVSGNGFGEQDESAKLSAGCIGENEGIKFQSGISRQTGRHIEVAKGPELARQTGRQRLSDGASKDSGSGAGMADGTRDSNRSGDGQIPEPSELLQGGSCRTLAQDRGGSGRSKSPVEEVEVSGPPQDLRLACVRVDRVESYKPTGFDGPWVYNLEVEEHHNYVAGGIVVGNCHYLKNPKSKRTKAVFGPKCDRIGGIAENADRVYCLSGTPAPNDPSELWPGVRALAPDLLDKRQHSYWGFVTKYCRTKDTGFGLQIVGGRNMGELRTRLDPFILRRKKVDVLPDLPALRLETLFLDCVSSRELSVLSAEYGGQIEAALAQDGIEGLAKLAPHIANLRRITGALKVAGVVETVSNEVTHDGKIVLFAYHTGVIEALETELLDAGFGVVVVDGAAPAAFRTERVRRFQEDPTIQVFIGQLTAAGTGLTLTAASEAIIVESSWVPAENEQAAMRIHRIGQRNACRVRFATLADSIDEKINRAVLRKAADIAQLFD